MTEADVLDALALRYAGAYAGNGMRYVFARQVRNRAGFDAKRTADALAMDLWPSKGLAIHGHEVKVSRSDWLGELRQPEKAEAFIPYCDYWWVVAPAGVVKREELPKGWGLLVIAGKVLVAVGAHRRLALPMPKSMMACFLRAVHKEAKRA